MIEEPNGSGEVRFPSDVGRGLSDASSARIPWRNRQDRLGSLDLASTTRWEPKSPELRRLQLQTDPFVKY